MSDRVTWSLVVLIVRRAPGSGAEETCRAAGVPQCSSEAPRLRGRCPGTVGTGV